MSRRRVQRSRHGAISVDQLSLTLDAGEAPIVGDEQPVTELVDTCDGCGKRKALTDEGRRSLCKDCRP